MDGARFDTWTRRRFGLVIGGWAAPLLGLAAIGDAAAKKRHKHKHRNKKKCRKSRQSCGGLKKCCKSLTCGESADGPSHCCKPPQGACTVGPECCGGFICSTIVGLDGTRCCSFFGTCTIDQDCCAGLHCLSSTCS